ncbi:MAG TPA: hypothetical protein VEZ55_13195, partial [Chitinophagaceae bacterium]|nr:hypothetical protein [Chitinophagaceae bacterium]
MKLKFLPALLFITVVFFFHWGCTRTKKTVGGQHNSVQIDDALFREHVRSSDPKTPDEELLSFQLPAGFEVSLYASEPLIGKPINMNFDAKGRLWVTQSFEYPFPAEPGKGSDKITILEDKNGDGKAETFTHFADSLNIPIGILPVAGGAIAYSIPFIYQFFDKDGDGKAESRKELIGPFGFKDTHG